MAETAITIVSLAFSVYRDHIMKIFDKYAAKNVRILNKKDATAMLKVSNGRGEIKRER